MCTCDVWANELSDDVNPLADDENSNAKQNEIML